MSGSECVTVHSHVRRLDLRAGTLTRDVEWSSPAGDREPLMLEDKSVVCEVPPVLSSPAPRWSVGPAPITHRTA
jgi:Glycosyl hydrolase family 65, N-terminal domain